MKKIFLTLTVLMMATGANAQIRGFFSCADPDAWFDKEIFFYAKNNANNGYYGLDIPDVSIVVNGEYRFDIGTWPYGEELVIDKSNDVDFEKGSTVYVYSNGQYITHWVCETSNPSLLDVAVRAYKMKPKGGYNFSKVLKYLKKVRL